jgi:hypothetical protein
MKIRPLGADILHADGQTDSQKDRHDEAHSRFSHYCKRAKKSESNVLSK